MVAGIAETGLVGCGDWLAFIFSDGVDGHMPAVQIVQVETMPQPPPSRVTIAVMDEGLASCWWDGSDDVAPIEPGTYLATYGMSVLLDGISRGSNLSPGERLRKEASIHALVCETMDAWQSGTLVAIGKWEGSLDAAERRRLVTARALMETRYREKWTIDVLARACGLGRGRLIRGFRELYGRTVADVLADFRLSGAAVALRASDRPVSQIAFDAGYCSNAAFTRAFVRRFGMPPSRFRAGGGSDAALAA